MNSVVFPNNDAKIGPNSRVKLHFTLCLENGEVVDSTRDADSAELRIGDGKLLPGFEYCLIGLRAGDSRSCKLEPEKAFGTVNPNNISFIERSRFPDTMQLEPGLMVSFAAVGGELPGVVVSLHGKQVRVDFNHPLAGRIIIFEFEIIAVYEGLLPVAREEEALANQGKEERVLENKMSAE